MPANKCANPFNVEKHKNVITRRISGLKFPGETVPEAVFLCNTCRKMVSEKGWPGLCVTKSAATSADLKISVQSESVDELDHECLSGESDGDFIPYFEQKKDDARKPDSDLDQILQNLKDKFQDPETSKPMKSAILTFMPNSWSERQVARTFGCSRSMVIRARRNEDKGFHKGLPDETKQTVRSFYENDSNSRILPGKRDFVSLKQANGPRLHVQKRLVLCNLRELYALFKKEHPDCKIGFSSFARLRPGHCVLAGSSGTHSVCVCTYHENVHLMIDGTSIPSLTEDSALKLTSYRDCLKLMVFESPTPNCHSGDCEKCQDNVDMIRDHLTQIFEAEDIEEVQYQVWECTDRATLITKLQEIGNFIEDFCDKLVVLRGHDFIAKQQSAYLNDRKQTLAEGEVLAMCDFAENYAFIAQNAAQSFHWNNNQASIHTVVYYYVEGETLKHQSMVILSDDLSHNTVAVYAFQRILIDHLRKQKIRTNKVIYFTDGASQHYKNRYNFANLMNHQKDFGIPAEWHFHETAHGKGACDGIGGNLKRLAAKASLQRPSSDQILTVEALFNWAKANLPKTSVHFSSKENHSELETVLKERFSSAKTIKGTLSYHAFIPIGDDQIQLKTFSSSGTSTVFPPKRGRKRKST